MRLITITHILFTYSAAAHRSASIYSKEELEIKWNTDFGFSGISTFAHLPYKKCLVDPEVEYDIAVVGAPFDTSVSYRPGKEIGHDAEYAANKLNRSSIWPKSNSGRVGSPNQLQKLQRPGRNQSLRQLGYDSGLRRYCHQPV